MTSFFLNFNSSKGQSNIFWIIIAAVIALIVMISLLFIFGNKTGTVSSGLSACESSGGSCIQGSSCSGGLKSPFECSEGFVCCVGGMQDANS